MNSRANQVLDKSTDPPLFESHRARGGRRSLALLSGLVVVWGLLMRQFGGGDVYAVMGPFALVVVGVVQLVRRSAFSTWFRPELRTVAIGVALGVGMTVATYPLFRLAVSIVPTLNGSVAALYRDADATSLRAMAWVSILVLAEELLWRGALLEALENRMAEPLAFALSVLTYALAQLGSGSWIVFALAIVCGTVWTFARRFTGSLVTSTVSHLIWTECVILIFPVT
jgi:membrane protease YdiL (CAAX protease family)